MMSTSTASFRLFAATAGLVVGSAAYAGDVQEAWVARFDGVAGEDDYADALATDSLGNVYVAGLTQVQVEQNLLSPFFLTLKYDPDGNLVWQRTHESNISAAASVLAVDPNDEVVVSGGVDLGDDWTTIKYSADGDLLWQHRYAANSTYVSEPDDIFIDAAGNVYITGDVGSAVNPDFGLILKYDAGGSLVWNAEYYGEIFDGAFTTSVIADDEGNVYIVGGEVAANASEAFVAKLDPSGDHVWTRTFGSTARFAHDRFNGVAFDREGNIVAGGTYGFNSIDGLDIGVVKLDPDGNVLWSVIHDGGFDDDQGNELRVDPDGNVLIAGRSDSDSSADIYLAKFSADGVLQWNQRFDGEAGATDYATGLAVAPDGAAYVAGVTQPFAGFTFYFTAKYAPDGSLEWTRQYGGPTDGGSRAIGIALGADRDVFVTGTSVDVDADIDIATIRYQEPESGSSATLVGVEVVSGTILDGGVDDLRVSDDAYLHTRSGFGETFVDLHNMELIVNAVSDVTSPATLDLTIESRIDEPSGSARISLRNWSAGEFEPVGAYAVGTSEEVRTIAGIGAASYVNASGEIDVAVKHIVFVPFLAFTFESFLDQVEITVQ